MKVCFVMLSHWTGTLGGAELQVRYIMEYLQEHSSHELTMICRHSMVDVDGGAPIRRTVSPRLLGRYFKSADYFSLMHHLRELDPDVIYTRVSSAFVGIAARYCRLHGKRLIYHIAHLEDVMRLPERLRTVPRRLERPMFEYGLRRADAIIAQADYQVPLLRQSYGRDCAAVIPNVHPVPDFTDKPSGRLRVMWVASLKRGKRPDLFLDLARRFGSDSDVEFIMVGGLQDARLASVPRAAANLPNLRYLGERPVEDVNQLLAESHLFVSTSEPASEGFPNTFIQAWLRGVPVASLDVDPDGQLTAGRSGFCAHGSMDELEAGIRSLARDRYRLQELGDAARRDAIAKYSIANVDRIQRLIEAQVPSVEHRSPK